MASEASTSIIVGTSSPGTASAVLAIDEDGWTVGVDRSVDMVAVDVVAADVVAADVVGAAVFWCLAKKIVYPRLVPFRKRQQKTTATQAHQQRLRDRSGAQCAQNRIECIAARFQYLNCCLRYFHTAGSRHTQTLSQNLASQKSSWKR